VVRGTDMVSVDTSVPSALRPGRALHLACAETAGAKHMATLDDALRRNAQRLKIKPVVLRDPP
jgi:uncharacterized protein